MDKKLKTKEVVHSVKEHAAAEVKDKALAAGIKSKDQVLAQFKEEAANQVPQRQQAQNTQSPESYAAEHVEDTTQNATENAVYTGERAIRYGAQKIKEHRAEKQAAEQVEAKSFAEELLSEELHLQKQLEVPSTENSTAPNQTHSGQPTQKLVPESSQEPTVPKSYDTSSLHDSIQHADSSDKHSVSREKDIKTKEPTPVDTKPGQTTEASTSNRIKQKERFIAKEKENTAAGQIKTREPTIRSNEALKAPKERGNQITGTTAAPTGEIKPTTMGTTHPADQAKAISASNDQMQISQSKEMQKRTVQGERQSSVNEPSKATQKGSSLAEKEDASSIKAHNRTVKESDKVQIREKEVVHPRVKEKTLKTGLVEPDGAKEELVGSNASVAKNAADKKAEISKKDVAAKKNATQNKKATAMANPKKKPDESVAVGKGEGKDLAPKRPAIKQKKKTPPKVRQKPTLPKAIAEKPVSKVLPVGLKSIKQRKGVPAGNRTIKPITEKAKEASKAATKTAKAAKKTAKAAKQAEERTKQAVQATKKAVQVTAKAVTKAVKASAKAITRLAELLGVSAPVVLLIIIVFLIAAIGGTCFGIFLSNDKSSGSEMTMAQAITQLTTDYYDSITKFQGQYNYDELEVKGSTAINWKDVLTIYAVKYTNESDGFDVVTLDKKKLKKIKEILLDMNPCTGVVVEKIVPLTKTTTDSRGQKITTTTYETQKVLIVTAVHVSATEQAKLYEFSKNAKGQVKELLSSDYDEMWNELIGSSGEIIISSSTHVPNFIFTWPLDGDYRISSGFGTRTDPINGVVKTHGGTDIAAAAGTLILAAADGVVETADYNAGGYGYYVKMAHGDGYETLYGHCSVLLVSTGQTVKRGQVIAKVGSTGHSTGPHLHFEVRYKGNRVNPMLFFK